MKGLRIALMVLALGAAPKPMGTAEVLNAAKPADWRPIAADNLLVMAIPQGQVLIELNPAFAPNLTANVRALAREHWFDGIAIVRVQDNYVVQWGDPTSKKPLGSVKPTLAPEFDRPVGKAKVVRLKRSGYGGEGFVDSWPVVLKKGRMWQTHCYATVGAGRNDTADSGPGSELYAVIGHAPRHLDRNSVPVGRVVRGIEILAALPRGTGEGLGMYEKPEQRIPVASIRLASDLPALERPKLEVLRSDTPTFRAYLDARAHRTRDGWFVNDAGYADLCNIRVPVRDAP